MLVEYIWNINFLLHENNPIGMVLKGLVGYNGNLSLIEVTAYLTALTILLVYFIRHYQFQHPNQQLSTTEKDIERRV